tara:strand:- start:127 stop:990 length:864 start_codon:yes stop_codon:yes gene_type:complete
MAEAPISKAINDMDYYDNSEHWGENQYVTLKNIIDNILITASDDSYFKKIPRYSARVYGKLAIKKMNVDVKVQSKAVRIMLSPNRIIAFPRYMTNWTRVSVMNTCGTNNDKLYLNVLNISNNPITADYLQDNAYDFIYDETGEVIQTEDINPDFSYCACTVVCPEQVYDDCVSDTDKYKDSWVKTNKEGGYFEFSNDLVGESIVIEYQSTGLEGLDDCDILVHHDLELTITRYIQWNLLMGQRNIPKSEYLTYKQEYKIEKARSEELLGNKISLNQIIKSIDKRHNA